jgi:hypothetical protein
MIIFTNNNHKAISRNNHNFHLDRRTKIQDFSHLQDRIQSLDKSEIFAKLFMFLFIYVQIALMSVQNISK